MTQWCDEFNKVALTDEAQARRVCAEMCVRNPDLPRLKTIAVVGAYELDVGGKGVDSDRLTRIMEYLLCSGFMIDPDFELDRINFRDGRDFLAEDKQADMVFVAFIPARHMYRMTTTYSPQLHERAEGAENFHQFFGPALSPHHSYEGWQDRLKQAGTKLVVTYGGAGEIGTDNLVVANDVSGLRVVLPTPSHNVGDYVGPPIRDDITYDIETKPDLRYQYNDAANDLPLKWLGFAADPEYLRTMRDHLSPHSDLARNVRKLAL